MLIFLMLFLLIGSFALLCELVAFCEKVIRPQAATPPETLVQQHRAAAQRKTLQVHIVRHSSV